MKNLFKEMLKDLPKGKIKIIPDDPKDKEISKQFESLINWQTVSEIFPLNQVSEEAANQFHETEKSFERFKNDLFKHCDILLKEYEKVKIDDETI